MVGPGAIGTTVAALVYAAGHEVIVCGRTPRAVIELRPDDGDPIVVPTPSTPTPPRSTDPPTWCCSPSRTPRTSRPRPGWPDCATSTPWCVRCRTASNRSSGSAGSAPSRRWSRAWCGSPPRHSPRAGCGYARRYGWSCPRQLPRRDSPNVLRGPRLSVDTRSRLRHRNLAQAAGQRRRRAHGADGAQIGDVPPRRRRRHGARATSPSAWRSRAPRAPTSATR